jgi:glycosyltransferase involved in cell wall biosynthesis
VGAARNAGLRRASAPYVLFLDQDDRLRPEALAHALRALHATPGAAFACGRCRIVDAGGVPWRSSGPARPVVSSDHYRALLRSTWIFPPATVLFRRAALVESGGWPEDRRMNGADDYHVYLRLARLHPVVDHADVLVEYRVHDDNSSRHKAQLLAGITYVLDGERIHTVGDRALERARRYGLRMWRRELGLRVAAQDLARAARDGRGLPRAVVTAVLAVIRHPPAFVRLVLERRRRGVPGRSWHLYRES